MLSRRSLLFLFILSFYIVLTADVFAAESTADINLVSDTTFTIDVTQSGGNKTLKQDKKYIITFTNLPMKQNDNEIILIGKFYDYKDGYRSFFSKAPLALDINQNRATAKFSLYSEKEGGYYSIRIFCGDSKLKDRLFSRLSGTTISPKNEILTSIFPPQKEVSMIEPSCADERFFVQNTNVSNINQVDIGLAYLYKRGKLSPFLFLNGYPYAFNRSYRDAYMHSTWSKVSVSFGIGLESNSDSGDKQYFGGITIPFADGFSGVVGYTLATSSEPAFFSAGIQLNADLLATFLQKLAVTKPSSF